ncbi:MAG: LysM peptidoglycan-binding domain-containing protein [Chitinophagales bacterium]|nr:LysM peptidoglycan-binding domain-containing protein [Chitinophagales bacterium]
MKNPVILIITLALAMQSLAQYQSSERCELDPVIRHIDSMFHITFTRDKVYLPSSELEKYINYPIERLPQYSDQELIQRLKAIPSVVPMTFNKDVKSFIEYFVFKRREMMTRMLANAQIYFPMFEETLDRYGLPLELKYLPIIESAFNPNAVSRAGATGLWQLMHGTGKMLGLEINSYVDERRDPARSTVAAINYLKQLYDIYGDWHLVLAAYNSGPGNVNKAIARSGGSRNFWTIMPYLPAETRSYVPIYIAAVYAMHYAGDYYLKPAEPKRPLYPIDTVKIYSKVSLNHIANVLEIPLEELQSLNPSLRLGIIPYTSNGFNLNLPVKYISLFEARKTEILNDPYILQYEAAYAVAATPKVVYEKIQKGETIYKVAAKYGCSVAEIKKWNGLRNHHLSPGMRLKIVLTPEPEVTSSELATTVKYTEPQIQSTNSPETDSLIATAEIIPQPQEVVKKIYEPVFVTHHVRKGETLSKIATRYRVHIKDILAWNHLRSSTVAAGQKLKIKTGEREIYTRVAAVVNNNESGYNSDCNCIKYVVRPGDTLWSISQRYEGLTVQKIKETNEFIQQRPIKVGDVLKLVF